MQHNWPLVAIEITTDDYETDNKKKLHNLYSKYPTLQECFLFNYERKEWQLINETGVAYECSHSPYIEGKYGIHCDFNTSLENSDIKDLFGLKTRKRHNK